MPLLIDGNNLLHAPMPPSLAGLDEAGLCTALGRTPWVREGVVIVFDGAANPLRLTESPVEGIQILHAGHSRTADDVIIARINDDTSPRRLIVVSSDHAIRKAARRRRCTAWTSDHFVHRLLEAMRTPRAAQDPPKKGGAEPLDSDEVDAWLRRFGLEEA